MDSNGFREYSFRTSPITVLSDRVMDQQLFFELWQADILGQNVVTVGGGVAPTKSLTGLISIYRHEHTS